MTSILFLSGRETDYIRNRVVLSALESRYDTTVLTGSAPNTPLRILSTLVKFLLHRRKYDLVFAGFYGQPLAIALSVLQSRPIILDAYVSTFETLCEDRRIVHPSSLMGRLAAWVDQYGCKVATQVVTDTEANACYLHEVFDVPRRKLSTVYVGCDDGVFYPRPGLPNPALTEVFYYGAFLPLQGIDVVVRAAAHLVDHPEIHFTIGGRGMCFENLEKEVRELSLTNVDMVGWIPFHELPSYIAGATICLGGHFSRIPKAARVISTKTFQFLAMRKPTIVGANPATAELFENGTHVMAVPMGDSEALATSILLLANDPQLREVIAEGGYALYRKYLSAAVVAGKLAEVVERALCTSRS